MSDINLNEIVDGERPMEVEDRKTIQSKIQKLKKDIHQAKKAEKKILLAQISALQDEMKSSDPDEKEIDAQIENNVTVKKGKPSRAQRRREKKEQARKEVQVEVPSEESDRSREIQLLKCKLEAHKLSIFQVPSDGDCLYSAISHQLSLNDATNNWSVAKLRQSASEYMLQHRDQFLPYLTNNETGNTLSDNEYNDYCHEVASTSSWGGQVEIRVLSDVLKRPIEVVHASTNEIIIGQHYTSSKLIVTFHRYELGLGAHYNSVLFLDHDKP